MNPPAPSPDPPAWTDIQDILLLGLKEKSKPWREIAAAIEGRDTEDCRERYDALVQAKAAAEDAAKKEEEEAVSKAASEEVAAKATAAAEEKDAKKKESEDAAKKKEDEEAAKKKVEEKEAGGDDNKDAESAGKEEGKGKKNKEGKSKSGGKEGKKNKGKGKANNSPPGDNPTDSATADDPSLNNLSLQDVRPFPFPIILFFSRGLKANVLERREEIEKKC